MAEAVSQPMVLALSAHVPPTFYETFKNKCMSFCVLACFCLLVQNSDLRDCVLT